MAGVHRSPLVSPLGAVQPGTERTHRPELHKPQQHKIFSHLRNFIARTICAAEARGMTAKRWLSNPKEHRMRFVTAHLLPLLAAATASGLLLSVAIV
jgi:hypothetical protein